MLKSKSVPQTPASALYLTFFRQVRSCCEDSIKKVSVTGQEQIHMLLHAAPWSAQTQPNPSYPKNLANCAFQVCIATNFWCEQFQICRLPQTVRVWTCFSMRAALWPQCKLWQWWHKWVSRRCIAHRKISAPLKTCGIKHLFKPGCTSSAHCDSSLFSPNDKLCKCFFTTPSHSKYRNWKCINFEKYYALLELCIMRH